MKAIKSSERFGLQREFNLHLPEELISKDLSCCCYNIPEGQEKRVCVGFAQKIKINHTMKSCRNNLSSFKAVISWPDLPRGEAATLWW